jgi:DNA-binding transcriptional LysR family regulator
MLLSLEQINLLNAINKYGSINTTAEKLFISKSGISSAIKNLEKRIGFELLDRSEYRVKLSHRGRMLLEKAEPLYKMQDDFQDFIKLLGDNIESHIKISSSVMYSIESLTKVLKAVSEKFPQTKIILNREVLSGEKLLLREDVDIAIVESRIDTSNLDFKKINKVKIPLLISTGHPFLKLATDKQNLSNLNKYPQIVLKSTLNDEGQGGVYQGAHKWQVSDMPSKKEFILQGLGWGRLPDFLIKKEMKAKKLIELKNIEMTQYLELYLAKRKSIQHGRVINFIWDIIKDHD